MYMKGGYDGIVAWTAAPLTQMPGAIRLGHVVDRISWNDDSCEPCVVECRDADDRVCKFEADAVVSTLPLGVLHHGLVSFNPPLPRDIQHGISNVSYGALGKVFFEFDDVFWPKDNDQFIFYPSPTDAGADDVYSSSLDSTDSPGVDNILLYATVTINLWIMTGGNELCVQIAEPLTQRIEAMTDKKALWRFFEPLFKLLRTEPYKALPKLMSVETTHWTQDRFAGFGSYSADKVGDDPRIFMKALDTHQDSRLQFAGEHCTIEANGCVHGAFATGEKAAKNILSTFGIEYDGGDLVSH